MKRSRFTNEQIVAILAEAADGTAVTAICRRHEIGTATFYAWRRRFGAESPAAVARIRGLEARNAALRQSVARREEDVAALRELLVRRLQTTGERRAAARWLIETRQYSERRACELCACDRSTFRYERVASPNGKPLR